MKPPPVFAALKWRGAYGSESTTLNRRDGAALRFTRPSPQARIAGYRGGHYALFRPPLLPLGAVQFKQLKWDGDELMAQALIYYFVKGGSW